MNYYGAHEMANSWRTVRNNTIRTAEDIPADQYNFRATDDTMTVAELLGHLATNTLWSVKVNLAEKRDTVTGQLMLMQRMLGIVPHLTGGRQERMAAMAAARA